MNVHLHLYLFLSFFLFFTIVIAHTLTGTDNRRPVRYCQSRAAVIVTVRALIEMATNYPLLLTRGMSAALSPSVMPGWRSRQLSAHRLASVRDRRLLAGRLHFHGWLASTFMSQRLGRLLIDFSSAPGPARLCLLLSAIVSCAWWLSQPSSTVWALHVTCEDRQTFADLCVCVHLSLSPHSFPLFFARFLQATHE